MGNALIGPLFIVMATACHVTAVINLHLALERGAAAEHIAMAVMLFLGGIVLSCAGEDRIYVHKVYLEHDTER